MDISKSRQRPVEQERIADILALASTGSTVLDVGARDGYISRLLVRSFEQVIALDLEEPPIFGEGITAVAGDVTCLDFADNEFDTVVCAEVLEHIPTHLLQKACSELARVTRHRLVIGVPYKQDTRVGRTTCRSCGKPNPPWGHVNVFDQNRLQQLFQPMTLAGTSFIGNSRSGTNFFSSLLMDLAGNPFGTYHQEEGCVHCGAKLTRPKNKAVLNWVLAKMATALTSVQQPFIPLRPRWIHVLFAKEHSGGRASGN